MTQVAALIEYFEHADTRMRGLPMHNPALSVAAIGFQPWLGREIGVLITPWFMNLVLLPRPDEQWGEAEQGQLLRETLPSGVYEFIYGWSAQTGGYAGCSLFSPMFEFETQSSAEETAQAVMAALFDVQHQAPTDRQQALRAQRESVSGNPHAEEKPVSEPKPKPELSRRGFLTAGFGGDKRKAEAR